MKSLLLHRRDTADFGQAMPNFASDLSLDLGTGTGRDFPSGVGEHHASGIGTLIRSWREEIILCRRVIEGGR